MPYRTKTRAAAPTASKGVVREQVIENLGDFSLINDVFRLRAMDKVQTPLMAFPNSQRGVTKFEHLTGQDLDRFTNHTAKYYTRLNPKVVSSVAKSSQDGC